MSFSDVMCFYENSDWEENVQRRIAGLPLRQRQRDRRSLAHRLYQLEKARRAREAERIAKQIETDRLEAERLHAEEVKEQQEHRVKAEEIKELQERRVKEKPSNECVVCLDRIPCQVLVPCGHVFCETCCSQFQLCPIDRIPVQQHIRLKFA